MLQPRFGRLVAVIGAVMGCCTGMARAQVTQTNGPDIIVCLFTDTTRSSGTHTITINGVNYDQFDVGTTSANRGNAQINWYIGGGENRHPAISEGFYRYDPVAGRFEQLSVSSVKHGFEALQQNDCATPGGGYFGVPCTSSNNGGVTLGVGCADPYCCALNFAPGNMGPRFEINATTGLFPYSYSTAYVANSGPTRVRISDLQAAPAGTRYFEEAQYIVGDDAGWHNNFNNASWQEVSISPAPPSPAATSYSTALSGSIHREQPAIYAWQAIDPSVTITSVDVPNDGRFIVACRVSGTGPYTYEYAVHNLNSHRCGGSFIVPLPGTEAALSGIGFHDVEYQGEPNATPANASADDWSVNDGGAGSTQVTWTGPAYNGTPPAYTMTATPYKVATFTPGTGNDHSANVLRWGTMYNFRFTSEVAPGAAGSVGVGLWRPGTGAPYIVVPNVPTPGGMTVNVTASCCTGTVCSVATQAACSAGTWGMAGTTCTPDPCILGACCTSGICTNATSPSCAGAWSAAGVCNPNPCPIPSGACCQNNACAFVPRPSCTGAYGGDDSVCSATTCPYGNDACANAAWISAGVPMAGSTVGATVDGTTSCGTANSTPDVWFKYRPASAGSVMFKTCGSGYDTVLSLHSAPCGATISSATCNDDSTSLCGSGTLQSGFTYTAAAGTTYYVRVSGYNGATGNYVLTVTGGGGTAPTGACCAPDGTCSSVARTGCIYSYQGDAVACGPTLCPQPSGACCSGAVCSVVSSSACTGANTRFVGVGAACNAAGNQTTPCCKGDFNQNGDKTVQDLFDYLAAWFTNSPQADINGGGVSVQDLFDFLAVWFPGC